jgi:spore germination cell wall hydrolase CwlJ-like protein
MRASRTILPGLICILASLYANDASAGSLRDEQQCLALAMYWEARGEGRPGMVAVGWIILNRAGSQHFPATPCAVVYQGSERSPCQFSWWCDGKSDRPRNRNSWTKARIIAAEILVNPPRDPTNGALFYHSNRIPLPWRRPRVRTVRIGNHIFYR